MHENQETGGLITKVEQQKRNKKRYNLYIEDEYAFSVHEEILVSLRLLRGKQVSSQDIKEILLEEERKKIERAMLHYLGYRPRTIAEVTRFLMEKGYEQELIQTQLTSFIDQGYLNDEEFAQQWIAERMRTKKKGHRLLAEELKQKGISPAIIEKALSQRNHEEEWQACYQLALKKIGTYNHLAGWQAKHKLRQYLTRRGFSFDVIESVYTEIMEDKGDSGSSLTSPQ